MRLCLGLKFTQDGVLNCEVIKIYTEYRKTAKTRVKIKKIDILKNDVLYTYEYDCFQKSFSNQKSTAFTNIKRN